MKNVLGVVGALLAAASGVHAGQICILPSAQNGVACVVDCDSAGPTCFNTARVGYSTDGSPCWEGPCVWPDSPYELRISASATDPYVNSGALPPGPHSLYLWLSCTTFDGMAALECDLVTFGDDLEHLSTNVTAGLNVGTDQHLLYAVGGGMKSLHMQGSIVSQNI